MAHLRLGQDRLGRGIHVLVHLFSVIELSRIEIAQEISAAVTSQTDKDRLSFVYRDIGLTKEIIIMHTFAMFYFLYLLNKS